MLNLIKGYTYIDDLQISYLEWLEINHGTNYS